MKISPIDSYIIDCIVITIRCMLDWQVISFFNPSSIPVVFCQTLHERHQNTGRDTETDPENSCWTSTLIDPGLFCIVEPRLPTSPTQWYKHIITPATTQEKSPSVLPAQSVHTRSFGSTNSSFVFNKV